ncbi:hypothetical protein FACS1894167_11360 [Synergistales bacterium]|nr:hypothetical protein FACS1894167_11360 [Synergistales bacterium]GHV54360.1 hypothetical protein FACS1894216_14220 [Synergistales bacterium]
MESRSVPLLVGSQIYPLITTLDDEKLDVVYKILRDTVAATPPTLAQDQRLFIASIKLADDLVNITRRMEAILALVGINEPERAEDYSGESESEASS